MISPPFPSPGVVHLWQGSLKTDEARLARLREHLSHQETEREQRLLDREIARRFAAGRGMVREVLARYLRQSPASLTLRHTPGGKPFVDGHDLRFNVSHSGELVIIAVTVGCEVGADLELIRSDLDFLPLARTCFSRREMEELLQLPAGQQRDAFYRCWTRKEAYLKAVGTGFSQSSKLFDVTLLPGVPAALAAHGSDAAEPGRWHLADLSVPGGYCAALAVEGYLSGVRYFACSP